jgi:hypothetical protein
MYWVAYVAEVITLCVFVVTVSIYLYNIGLCYRGLFLCRVFCGVEIGHPPLPRYQHTNLKTNTDKARAGD